MSEESPEHLRYKIEDSHEEIWLEPQCAEHSYEGRTWAHNCAWDEKCGECGSPPVKYRRADLCLSDPRVKALVEAALDVLPDVKAMCEARAPKSVPCLEKNMERWRSHHATAMAPYLALTAALAAMEE